VSNTAKERAREFEHLYLNDDIKIIIPPWGGLLLIDMLPFLDFDKLRNAPPKWVMGFSDISILLFALTTKLDIATAHGPNALDFAAYPMHETVKDSLKYLSLDSEHEFAQKQTEYYQKEWNSVEENRRAPYNLHEKTVWKSLRCVEKVSFEGRLIGGCLDVLCKLIGTPYANINGFMKRNNDYGFYGTLKVVK